MLEAGDCSFHVFGLTKGDTGFQAKLLGLELLTGPGRAGHHLPGASRSGTERGEKCALLRDKSRLET